MLRRILLALLALVALLGGPAPSATATDLTPTPSATAPAPPESVGIRLVDVPVAAQADPRAHAYIIDRLAPGTTITRRVEVQNNTLTAQSVRVYTGPAAITAGVFTVGATGAAPTELTTWATVAPPRLELAPGQRTDAVVTIAVPPDAAEAESYGVVWAEITSPAAPGKSAEVSRVGVRIYLAVGPGNGPAAAFGVAGLTAGRSPQGAPMVTALVSNVGGRAVDVSGSLTLAGGPGGLTLAPVPVARPVTLAPGTSAEVTVVTDRALPTGPWDATLALHSGLTTGETTGQLTFPAAGQPPIVAAPQPQPAPGNPWIAVWAPGLALFLIAGLLLWWWARRRRQAQDAQA